MTRGAPWVLGAIAVAAVGAAWAAALERPFLGASRDMDEARGLTGGDPARGRFALDAYGCGTCHTIPGVPEARGLVGPPLTHFANRLYVAGAAPNTPDNLVAWIEGPRRLAPETAMPDLGVGQFDARDIAAYLYTLK
jgi:cytochrome c2